MGSDLFLAKLHGYEIDRTGKFVNRDDYWFREGEIRGLLRAARKANSLPLRELAIWCRAEAKRLRKGKP